MRLVTIPISHYCEKARWALERAGLPYEEERHVQAVHRLYIRRAGGRGTAPVLITADEGLVDGSEAILRYADARTAPEQRLFPDDPALRADVEALSRWLDDGLGKDGRRWIYARLLPHRRLTLRFNNQGLPRWEGVLLALTWPTVMPWIGKQLGIGPATVREDADRVRHAFDAVARRLADGRPYLCGERFTAADLTFACLASPVLAPPQYGVRLPQPPEMPAEIAGDIEAFRAHPAGAYALALYRAERVERA